MVSSKKYFLTKKNNLAIFFVIIFNIILHFSFLDNPTFGDETTYLYGAIKTLRNGFNPFVEYWSYKPPLIAELTALMFKIFKIDIFNARIIVLFFSSVAIFFTYKIGEKLHSCAIGIFAAVLLMLNPLFFAQSNLFLATTFVTALFLATFYFYLTNKKMLYLFFASLFILTKETNALILLTIGILDVVGNFEKIGKKDLFKRQVFLLSPLFLLIIWMILNKLFLGWFLWPYNLTYFSGEKPNYYIDPDLIWFFKDTYINGLKGVYFGLIFLGYLLSVSFKDLRKIIFKKELIYFIFLSLFFPLFFFRSAFIQRYYLFIYPGLFIILGILVSYFLKKKRVAIGTILLTFVIYQSLILKNSYYGRYDIHDYNATDLGYIYYLDLNKEIVSVFESYGFDNFTIMSAWLNQHRIGAVEGYSNHDFRVIIFDENTKCDYLDTFDESFVFLTSPLHETTFQKMELCALEKKLKLIENRTNFKIYVKQ